VRRKNPHIGGDALAHAREMVERNPALKAEYERTLPHLRLVSALIGARDAAGLTQKQFAERMGVDVRAVWRLESLDHSPRLDRLQSAAEALDCDLEVRFVPRHRARTRGVAEDPPAYAARRGATRRSPR
jgi:ribosome-binding protein aMBF1 (putative translation factor)